MRIAFLALALLFSSWIVADEARPVYVEVVENNVSQFLIGIDKANRFDLKVLYYNRFCRSLKIHTHKIV